jgi:hypothetical protein
VTRPLSAWGLCAIASAAGFAVAAFLAAAAGPSGRWRATARGIALASATLLLAVVLRAPAQPFVAFAAVAALAGPQPLALVMAAGAAVIAAFAPTEGPVSLARVLGAAAAAVAAHAVGHSLPGALGTRPAEAAAPAAVDAVEEDQAAVLSRLAVVLALLAALAAGVEGWLRAGTYVSAPAQRLLAASLASFAASETVRGREALRALALAALLLAVLAR